jgi:taurine transport system permease protein
MVLKPERTPTRNPSRKSPIYRFVTPERAIPLGAVLLIFALWYLSTSLGCANPLFLPTPAAVWSAFVDILQSGYKVPLASLSSFSEYVPTDGGAVLATVTAIPLGMLCGFSKLDPSSP